MSGHGGLTLAPAAFDPPTDHTTMVLFVWLVVLIVVVFIWAVRRP